MPGKKPFSAAGQVWLSRDGENVLNEGRMALLEKIAETGSITKAGKAVGISYRTAWIAVDHLNTISDSPLVERTTGGKSGGGTRLTEYGRGLLKVYGAVQEEHRKYLDRLREGIHDFDRYLQLARKISLKTSARNQLFGEIESIRKDAMAATVVMRLRGEDKVISRITVEGLESLGLRKGEEAYALVKANWISLFPIGGRPKPEMENVWTVKIISIKQGKTDAEVITQLKGGNSLVAVVPMPTVRRLKLEEGTGVIAAFSASNVILGVAR